MTIENGIIKVTEEEASKLLDWLRPKGEWIVTELFYEGESNGAIIKCNKCGNEMRISPRRFENLYSCEKFCGMCGADMRGVSE